MKKVAVRIKRKAGCQDLPLPQYMSPGASGMDLYADVDGEITLAPGEIKLVSAGIYLSIPKGYEAEVRPRSGLALKYGIGLVNSPGTIDSDYRGLVNVIMTNWGKEPFLIKRGDRIAQIIVKEVIRAEFEVSEELDETIRSTGGFGHTGI